MREYDPLYVHVPVLFQVGVKVIVTHSEGGVLFLRRSEKCSRAHGWDFPGGGVEAGENPVDACIREVLEETGLMVFNITPITTHVSTKAHGEESGNELIIGYHASTNAKNVTLSWEHEHHIWMPIEEGRELDLPELHRKILASL